MSVLYYRQSLPSSSDFNARLNRYFVDCVQLRKKETKSIKDIIVPIVEEILKEIHDRDPLHIFGDKPIRVGSSHSGLKVGRANEFDFSVPLLNIGNLEWDWAPGSPFFYSLISPDGFPKNDDTNFDQNLKIVHTYNQLPSPGPGYCQITLNYGPAYQYQAMMVDNILIPYLVKRYFKRLFSDAVDSLNEDATRATREVVHGPALTKRFTVKLKSKSIIVSVDFTPIVQARLPFQSQMNWPRNKTWPSEEKIKAILKIGVSLVAKKNMHWYCSFAECEKELVREMDKENGRGVRGQRKKVHRIMKRFFETTWSEYKPEECVLTSYMIKNAWFWECERYPENEQWQEAYLTERFESCVELLIGFIQKRELPLYFHEGIDLLKGQESKDFSEVVKRMRTWRRELISKYM